MPPSGLALSGELRSCANDCEVPGNFIQLPSRATDKRRMGLPMDDASLAAEIVADPDRGPESEPQWPYVLIVDDQQVVRDFLKRCLEGWGYSVKQAGSAIIALEVMTASPASVVLCDVRMPIHDGLWLVERLRARWPDVPIVMITAAQDDETVAASRQLGAFEFLTKPIAARQLRE